MDLKEIQERLHVCGDCKNGIHGTCFGTCECVYCDDYWEKKNG